jgi:NADP-dependent alcohol dehydrogenase
MTEFTFFNPTRVHFGLGQSKKIRDEIKIDQRLLILSGGGSIHKNGIYENIISHLKGYTLFEFNGISANPEYKTLLKARDIAVANNCNWILAIGGGSVIDGAKFVAAAACLPKELDPWDYIIVRKNNIEKALPIGCVLTLPATGSESNPAAVISRNSLNDKLSFKSTVIYPRFAIMDPKFTFSLPIKQVENGVVDAFIHTTEQYITNGESNPLQDRWAEAILITLIEYAPRIVKDTDDTKAREILMWTANQALFGLIGAGQKQDWLTHAIAHELTALYGLDHARALTIVWPNVIRFCFEQKLKKLAQYGRTVWKLSGDDHVVANLAIEKTITFFNSLNFITSLKGYNICSSDAALNVQEQLIRHGRNNLGENKDISPQDCMQIVNRC